MINYWELDNKARLVVEEIPHIRSAAIGIYIGLGSRHEPEGMKGSSHFIEHMLFKGTERRSAREIAEKFEEIGGQLNAFTSKEYTCLYARTLDENIVLAADILFDMLFNSKFAARDFETEKGVIIEEINMNEDAPDDLIHDLFARSIWFEHSMGSPILGTLTSVSDFNREGVYELYKNSYVPANMVISVAGNVNSTEIKELIEKHLADKKNSAADVPYIKPYGYNDFINLMEKDTEQVQICVGVPGISYHDENRDKQHVMNSIFGGGMSSRLFQKLREELGLVYSIYSYSATYSDTGSYAIYIGTGPNNISKCLEALYGEIDSLISQGIKPEEMERTQKLIKSSMYLGLESVMNRMSRLGKSIMMYDKTVSPEDVIKRIFQVKEEQVQDYAVSLLGKQAISIAAIGASDVLTEVEKEYKKWWG